MVNGVKIIKEALNKRTEAISAYYLACPRLAAYEYGLDVGSVLEERGRNLLSLNLGGYVHARILTDFEQNGCEIEKRVPLDDYGCPGHKFKVDAVCGDVAYEIKTASTDRARPFWEFQLKSYLSLLGLKKGKLEVIWMPSRRVSEYNIYVSDEEAERIRDRVRRMCAVLGRPWQEVEPTRGRWCELCPIKNVCMNGELFEKNL